jgi:hypothetical protein
MISLRAKGWRREDRVRVDGVPRQSRLVRGCGPVKKRTPSRCGTRTACFGRAGGDGRRGWRSLGYPLMSGSPVGSVYWFVKRCRFASCKSTAPLKASFRRAELPVTLTCRQPPGQPVLHIIGVCVIL